MSRLTLICCIVCLFIPAVPLNAEPLNAETANAEPAESELTADYLMLSDPKFDPLPRIKDFKRDFKGIWQQALERPEADYQRMAAETVARAHEYGIPGMTDLAPALEKIVAAPQSHPAARFAAARALVALDSRGSSAALLDAGLKYGADLRQLVEPALAQWDFAPARPVWTARLSAPRTFPRDLILAVRGLGKVRETAALSDLSRIATDPLQPRHIRLESARAAGEMADSGLETPAEQLARDRRTDPLINRLCAVRFLARHTSESARRLLIELASDPEPSLAAAALRRLNEIDPELVVPLAEQAMRNADPLVRKAGAFAYIHRPSTGRMKVLANLLSDDHPVVRKFVGANFYRLAQDAALGEVIRTESMRILAGDRWQGQVEATLVLGMLDHKPAADRFVALLESTRPDVMAHSAWGLRKLAESRTLPAIMDKIQRQTIARNQGRVEGVDEQVAHLFEACGKLRAMEAEPLMLPYVPKDLTRTMDLSRGAAIWALGHLHQGTPDVSLADALVGRIMDTSKKPFESPLVKRMSIVALVRMRADKHAESLKKSLSIHPPTSLVDLANRWAIRELTGETVPDPAPLKFSEGKWFLEPLILNQP